MNVARILVAALAAVALTGTLAGTADATTHLDRSASHQLVAATTNVVSDPANDQKTYSSYRTAPAAIKGYSEIVQVTYSVTDTGLFSAAFSTAKAGKVTSGYKHAIEVTGKVGTKHVVLNGLNGGTSYLTVEGANTCAGKVKMVTDPVAKTATVTVPVSCLPRGKGLTNLIGSSHTYTSSAMNPVVLAYDTTVSTSATLG